MVGIDVIITSPSARGQLPAALAVLNPNLTDSSYPDRNLCGAGVTFKLVQALLSRARLARSQAAAYAAELPVASHSRP